MQSMNGTIKVIGGVPLRGTVTPIPNKNSIMPALPAAILSSSSIKYYNIPDTLDVQKHLKILEMLGAKIDTSNESYIEINCKDLNSYSVDQDLGSKFRSSIMYVGPLLARFGKAIVPLPGGCLLGRRSISAHIDSFQKAGVAIEYVGDTVVFTAPKKLNKNYKIWQMEASVTATENLCMYAAGVDSTFEILDAATEPHVTDLLNLLSSLGAQIDGISSNRLIIKGNCKLSGGEFIPRFDFVDVSGFIVATALTKGEIRITGANDYEIMGGLVDWFRRFNISIEEDGKDLVVSGKNDLKIIDIQHGFPSAGKDLPKLTPRPWPGFPVDVIPVMVTLTCKLEGRFLIQNWMYESGLDFAREINNIGGEIFMSDPQRLIVNGPVNFKGGEVVSPKVIQACKAIFLASLADPVETVLHGVDVLSRRYPDIFPVYSKLGANIEIL